MSDSVRLADPLFRDPTTPAAVPTSALQLAVEEIPFADARALNRLWHSRLPRIGDPAAVMTAGIHFGAAAGGVWYAAAIWTHPVARKLPQKTWLELRRFAVAPDAPKNTASRVLAVMTRLIRKARPDLVRLISYQDTEAHAGTIYRAAGWAKADLAGASSTDWNMPGRPRPKAQSTAPKQRWELALKHGGGPGDRG